MQIENIELPHTIYDKLVKNKVFTVEQLAHILISSETHEEEAALGLTPTELVEVSKAISRAQQKETKERVDSIIREEVHDWLSSRAVPGGKAPTTYELIEFSIKAYERMYGVGSKVMKEDTGTCACGRDRTECIKNLPCAQKS